MTQRRKPVVRDRGMAQWGGYALLIAGSLLLWDAYENRGRSRPFFSKLMPGG